MYRSNSTVICISLERPQNPQKNTIRHHWCYVMFIIKASSYFTVVIKKQSKYCQQMIKQQQKWFAKRRDGEKVIFKGVSIIIDDIDCKSIDKVLLCYFPLCICAVKGVSEKNAVEFERYIAVLWFWCQIKGNWMLFQKL